MSWIVSDQMAGGPSQDLAAAFSRSSFATTDVDEARDVLTRTYADHSFRPRGRSARGVRLGHDAAMSPLINIGYTSLDADVDIAAPPSSSAYIVGFASSGHATMRSGRQSTVITERRAAIASPGRPFGFDVSEGALVVGVRISRDAVEQDLASLTGRPVSGPIRFDFDMDIATGAGAGFLRTLHLIETELERPDGMARNVCLTERLSRLLITSLLTAQPHDHTDQLYGPPCTAPSAAVRAAMEFIEAYACEITTVAQIANAACVGVRAIEEGFRTQIGVPPMAYLREVRLAGVHEELLNSELLEVSITSAARRWGFTHLSRFSQAYRQKYGVLPSETLRGRRPPSPSAAPRPYPRTSDSG